MSKLVKVYDNIRGVEVVFDCEKAIYFLHPTVAEVHIDGLTMHVAKNEMAASIEAHNIQVTVIQPEGQPVNAE